MHPKYWNKDDGFLKMKQLIKSMPVINDCAERTLGMITVYYGMNSAPKTIDEKKKLFKIIHSYRLQQKKLAVSKERCTKKVLAEFQW